MNYQLETVNPDQISRLNQLSWDKRKYLSCFDGEQYYLMVVYKFNTDVFRYRVNCSNKKVLELLRERLENNVH